MIKQTNNVLSPDSCMCCQVRSGSCRVVDDETLQGRLLDVLLSDKGDPYYLDAISGQLQLALAALQRVSEADCHESRKPLMQYAVEKALEVVHVMREVVIQRDAEQCDSCNHAFDEWMAEPPRGATHRNA